MRKEILAYNKGYRISEDGSIIGASGKIILGSIGSKGYLKINFRHYGKLTSCSAHRLQAFQKYGDKIYCDGVEVRHLNGDKIDNSHSNILIGSHSENMMDIPSQIRISSSLNATSFVRKHDKYKITEFYNKCNSYKKTMIEFNISSKGTLHFILNKRQK